MALRIFRHKETEEIKRVLSGKSPGDNWEEVIQAPSGKFMVAANKATGKSKLKDADKILKERARNHSRDVDADDVIQKNLMNGLKESVATNLLNEKGQRRRKIDDI